MDKDRRLAYLALKEIETEGCWSNLALEKVLNGHEGSSGFIRELVYGCLRNRLLLDYNIGLYLKKPGLKTADRILLRMGFYQLCFMDSVTDYGAVSETVALAKTFAPGRDGFINAVLRSFLRQGKELKTPVISEKASENQLVDHLSIKYSAAPWIVSLWLKELGKEKAEELLAASVTPAPLMVRVNEMKIGREELADRLAKLGFEAEPSKNCPTCIVCRGSGLLSTELYSQGFFSVQGEASQMAALILDPEPGETVMDLCAAPGGKTCAMAEIMKDDGVIYSFDLYEQRIKLIEASAKRLGLTCIKAKQADASVFLKEFRERADRVLCDVPCSGLGVLRQKPEIKLRPKPAELDSLPGLQLAILKNGAKYLKKGGKLLYSTCTVNKAENRAVIDRFLADEPSFAISFERQLYQTQGGHDGFYICLLTRKTEA